MGTLSFLQNIVQVCTSFLDWNTSHSGTLKTYLADLPTNTELLLILFAFEKYKFFRSFFFILSVPLMGRYLTSHNGGNFNKYERHEKTFFLQLQKQRVQVNSAVTAPQISTFDFATLIVQSLYFLYLKFQASNHFL